MLVMSWILGICTGKKVGAYLSDISGAFDRVCKKYILAKLYAAGIGATYLNFLDAYLAPREGKVVVQGESSDLFKIEDSIFQGTVLGPALWNVFFADVAIPAGCTGGNEAMFADDLNVFQLFERELPTESIIQKLSHCRNKVHGWGRMNRVSFDAKKEHLAIIHPDKKFQHGEGFRLLGCFMDLDLRMQTAVDQLLAKIRPKSKAILRTRGYYSIPELLIQYKTHVWGLVECNSGAFFHTVSSLLTKIDEIQENFYRN